VSTNTAVGASALAANTTGSINSAFGFETLQTATTSGANTAVGYRALRFASTGDGNNTGIGTLSLEANTTGSFNTATGRSALLTNTTGTSNSAYGVTSLNSNTTGSSNVAVGRESLYSNTTASNNTAVGYQAGYANTTGSENTFVGQGSGVANTTGSNNACFGRDSGAGLTTGLSNTFIGRSAGETVTTGTKNTILGRYTGNQGGLDIRTSSNNIVLSDGDGNVRLYAESGNSVRFGTQGVALDAPGITSNTTAFTDLSSTPQNVNIQAANAAIFHFFLGNNLADTDHASWTIFAGRDGGTAHNYSFVGGGNCSISQSSRTFTITGLGDGVTYTLVGSAATCAFTFAASSTLTGTTRLNVLSITSQIV
jgi:hypothetical protein